VEDEEKSKNTARPILPKCPNPALLIYVDICVCMYRYVHVYIHMYIHIIYIICTCSFVMHWYITCTDVVMHIINMHIMYTTTSVRTCIVVQLCTHIHDVCNSASASLLYAYMYIQCNIHVWPHVCIDVAIMCTRIYTTVHTCRNTCRNNTLNFLLQFTPSLYTCSTHITGR
jgi:hypothetical protein